MKRNWPGADKGDGTRDGDCKAEGDGGDGEMCSVVLVSEGEADGSELADTGPSNFSAPVGAGESVGSVDCVGGGAAGAVDVPSDGDVDEGPAVTVRADDGTSFVGCTGVLGREDCGDGTPDEGDLIPIAEEEARCRERVAADGSPVPPSTTCVRAFAAAVSLSNRRRTFFKASPCSRASRNCSSVSASFMRSVATILFAWELECQDGTDSQACATHLFKECLRKRLNLCFEGGLRIRCLLMCFPLGLQLMLEVLELLVPVSWRHK